MRLVREKAGGLGFRHDMDLDGLVHFSATGFLGWSPSHLTTAVACVSSFYRYAGDELDLSRRWTVKPTVLAYTG